MARRRPGRDPYSLTTKTVNPNMNRWLTIANGALCLGTTRIANTSVACNLPSCSSFDMQDDVWATYVPTP